VSEFNAEQLREAYLAELLKMPFHDHLGIALDRDTDQGPRLVIESRPQMANENGELSPAAVFTLGEAASAAALCEAIIPHAVARGLGAIFFTVTGTLRPQGRAVGKIAAVAEVVNGIDVDEDGVARRKAEADVVAKVMRDDGAPVGEHRFSYRVRFMEISRMGGMLRPESEFGRLIGS
jgi:hypothetical protein